MIFKIRTCEKTMKLFEEISASTNYAPFILSKLAISMSLKSKMPLNDDDFKTDSLGLELNRQTITGEYDALYKSLIEMFEHRHISEDEYMQKYLKAHIDRGAQLIHSEFRYSKDFLLGLLREGISI